MSSSFASKTEYIMSRYSISNMMHLVYAGVDPTMPGNGGIECVQFSSPKQRIIETLCGTSLGVYEVCYAYRCIQERFHSVRALVAKEQSRTISRQHDRVKSILLVILCLVFGIEIGFKFATKQVIFLLNPCHIVTVLQVSVFDPNLYII